MAVVKTHSGLHRRKDISKYQPLRRNLLPAHKNQTLRLIGIRDTNSY